MTTRLIFIRHGQSVGNLTGRYLGHYDGALTDLGREQARLAADYFRDTKIDAAYASDLSRAYETGSIIAAPHGLVPIPDIALREISAGKWENMEFTRIEELYPEDWRVWRDDAFSSRPTGGESVMELYERVTSEVWRIAAENRGKTVLVATHATPIRALKREWSEMGQSDAEKKWVGNASATTADYDTDNHTVKVIRVSDESYLGKLSTGLSDDI